MVEKRCPADIYATDLEAAQMALNTLKNGDGVPEEIIRDAAARAKRIEIKLAATRLGQAEYYLDTLKSRIDFLQARATSKDGAAKREIEELEWARAALPANLAAVTTMSNQLEDLKRELEELRGQDLVVASGR